MLKRLVRMQRKGAIVIPSNMRQQVGVSDGDIMQVEVLESSQFLITPQVTISRAVVVDPKKNHKQILADLAATVADIRAEAKAAGLDNLTMREINATVAEARRAQTKTRKRPVK